MLSAAAFQDCFLSKSYSFNLISLSIVTLVLIHFSLCNKHSETPTLTLILSKTKKAVANAELLLF